MLTDVAGETILMAFIAPISMISRRAAHCWRAISMLAPLFLIELGRWQAVMIVAMLGARL